MSQERVSGLGEGATQSGAWQSKNKNRNARAQRTKIWDATSNARESSHHKANPSGVTKKKNRNTKDMEIQLASNLKTFSSPTKRFS